MGLAPKWTWAACCFAVLSWWGVFAAVPGAELKADKPFDLTPGLEGGDQRWPAAAFGRDVYLVVWQEGEAMAGVKDTNILAARVSADGKPLDPKGFAVCSAAGFQAYPMVAFDGANFLVAWQDYRNGRDWDLYAARVAPDGRVLDADGFAVAAVPGNQIYPAVASDGKGSSLIVWSDVRPGFQPELYQLYGTLVRDGRPADAGGRELSKAPFGLLRPWIAWDGEGYGIVASHNATGWVPGQPWGVRVTPDGQAGPWKIPGFMAQTYCLAAAPAAKKAFVFSNCRAEHGSYCNWYHVMFVKDPASGSGSCFMVAGLQDRFAPRNDLRCAAVFDGKNFVAVVEQVPEVTDGYRDHKPVNVKLVASRFSADDGMPLDLGGCAVSASNKGDLRAVVHSAEFKQAVEKKLTGVTAAAEPGVQLRHPALASSGDGRSLLVYSRRGGPGRFKINGVLQSE
ncbi:MAG: hypothetical protein N3A38_05675 [Planctomycetota bacterium]|nr:hypothetical protein [Planctomycetota bacterium]